MIEVRSAHEVDDADWDRVVRHATLGQFWHYVDWRAYSLAFAGPGAEDDSFAVVRDGTLDAVCPLIWEPQTSSYTMGGEPGPLPASWTSTAHETAMAHAKKLAEKRGVRLSFRLPSYAGKDLDFFGWAKGGWQTRCVALTTSAPYLWRAVRKSYHSLIHKTERTHRLVVSFDDALALEYQALHQATVGTIMPRRQATYDYQAKWLRDERAILLGAQSRETGAWDGFVYVFLFHRHAYYGSGPSRPGSGVMHGLQWAAIRMCQRLGLQTYEVGWQGHATDEKGRGIETFKRGFGGADVPLVTWTMAA